MAITEEKLVLSLSGFLQLKDDNKKQQGGKKSYFIAMYYNVFVNTKPQHL